MPRGYQRAPVYDETKGTVHIWARDGRAPNRLTDLIGGDVRRQVNSNGDKLGNRPDGLPELVDFYVVNRTPTTGDVRNGHRLGCDYGAIDLPAQRGWLADRIARAVDMGIDVTIWVG